MNMSLRFIRFCLATAIAFLGTQFIQAQYVGVDIQKLETEEFPTIKGKLWVRDPEGLHTESVKMMENDVLITNLKFEDLHESVDSVSSTKSILFLMPKDQNVEWHKAVILKAVEGGIFSSGDRFAVLQYGKARGEKIFEPDDKDIKWFKDPKEFTNQLQSLKVGGRMDAEERTHEAVGAALDKLAKGDLKVATGIVVMCDDRSKKGYFAEETPGAKSKRLNVPIYSIILNTGYNYYDISDLCKETFGQHFETGSSNEGVEPSSKELVKFMQGFKARHAGLYYPFSYESSLERDGKGYSLKLDSPNGKCAQTLTLPDRNFFEAILHYWPFVLGVLVLLIGGLFFMMQLRKKDEEKRAMEARIRQVEQEELEAKQRKNEEDLLAQKRQMEENQRAEQARRDQAARDQAAKAQAEQELADQREQIELMRQRGNFPWFEYNFQGQSGRFDMELPAITIGRDAACNWTINHPTVSRRHCQIKFRDHQYGVTDLGSSNGIFVNGHRVSTFELRHGDVLQVGDVMLTFYI
jgi:hypothetical protein